MHDVYLIRDWDEHFECAQSRKVRKSHSWVALPCKHDGKSFRRLMLMDSGLEIYGTWILIVQVAAKCPTRGVLADSDGPLTAEDLAIKTGASVEAFERALKVLSGKHIGWMLVEQWEGGGIAVPPPTNHTEQNKTVPTNQPPYPPRASSAAPNAEPPKAGGLAGGKVFDLTWEGVAQRLASLGVVHWSQATSDAQACGSDPTRCNQLIDYAQQCSFGPGAIAKRFAIASPQLGINAGWPNSERPDMALEKRLKVDASKRAQYAAEQAEQEAWRRIKAGRLAGRTDDQIRTECESAGLPWPNPARAERMVIA